MRVGGWSSETSREAAPSSVRGSEGFQPGARSHLQLLSVPVSHTCSWVCKGQTWYTNTSEGVHCERNEIGVRAETEDQRGHGTLLGRSERCLHSHDAVCTEFLSSPTESQGKTILFIFVPLCYVICSTCTINIIESNSTFSNFPRNLFFNFINLV